MTNLEPEAFPLARPETRHFYRAFGLNICSEFALPELDSSLPGAADLTIRLAQTGRAQPDVGSAFEFGVDAQYLAWCQVGGFLIRGTSEIDIERAPGANDRLLAYHYWARSWPCFCICAGSWCYMPVRSPRETGG